MVAFFIGFLVAWFGCLAYVIYSIFRTQKQDVDKVPALVRKHLLSGGVPLAIGAYFFLLLATGFPVGVLGLWFVFWVPLYFLSLASSLINLALGLFFLRKANTRGQAAYFLIATLFSASAYTIVLASGA